MARFMVDKRVQGRRSCGLDVGDKEDGIPGLLVAVSLDLEEVSPVGWWGHQAVSRWGSGFSDHRTAPGCLCV